MNSIKELIAHGAYSVDEHAVAEAILRRLALSAKPVPGTVEDGRSERGE